MNNQISNHSGVAPDVVTVLLAEVLYVGNQRGLLLLVERIPANPCDLFLAAGGEQREQHQLGLALPDPGLRCRLPVERLAFLINCLPFLHNADLGGEARRPVLALALRDGSHDLLHGCLRLLHCSSRSSKTGKNRNEAATIRD
ncbi:hypothetical protein [Pseudomonas oryzicola]|uniref:Uncharacterized protein n=1 Tax=Pseudomonas oryzicola TaxID=485876 RepID=A0ABS6QE15_9PSED|nr:hypothetical protein [Pseudomonas oryzicola]